MSVLWLKCCNVSIREGCVNVCNTRSLLFIIYLVCLSFNHVTTTITSAFFFFSTSHLWKWLKKLKPLSQNNCIVKRRVWRLLSSAEGLFVFGLASCQSFSRHAPDVPRCPLKSLWGQFCPVYILCNFAHRLLIVQTRSNVMPWGSLLVLTLVEPAFGGGTSDVGGA